MKYFYMPNLKISVTKLQSVGDTPIRQRSATGRTLAVVTDEVLAETKTPECKCENPRAMAAQGYGTLHSGMLVSELGTLGSGCTKGRWVCPRLDSVRRRYGK